MKKPWKLDPEDVVKEIELEPKSLQRDIDVLIAVAKAARMRFDKETSLELGITVKDHDHDLPVVNVAAKAASIKFDKETSLETKTEPDTAEKDQDRDDIPVNASWKDVIDRLKKKRGSGGRFDMKVVDRLQALNISSMPGKNMEDKVSDKFSKLVIFEGLSREELSMRERLLKKPMIYQEEEEEREHYRRMKRESKRPLRFENFGIIDCSLKKRRDFGGRFDHMKIVDQLQALDISMPRKKMEEKVSDKSKFETLSREELLTKERLLKKAMIFQHEEEGENHTRMMRDCKTPLRIGNFEEKGKRVRMEKVDTKKNLTAKKAKLQPELPNPPPDVPIEVMNRIEEMGGTEVKLVIQKTLQRTDCSSKHNRLSIPLNSVISKDFLDESGKEFLEGIAEDGTRNSIQVVLIQPDNLEPVDILLRKWSMKKENGRASHMYVLNKPWIDVVLGNRLEASDLIQLWSFRVDGNLCLALVRLPEINRN